MRNPVIFILLFVLWCCGNNKESVHSAHGVADYYTCSMHPEVRKDKPGQCPICGMALIPVYKARESKTDEIALTELQIKLGNISWDTVKNGKLPGTISFPGIVNFDQTQIFTISTRVAGRIVKLTPKNIGDFISESTPLYKIYSEELNLAKQEYLLAVQRRNSGVILRDDLESLVRGAAQKLQLWGLTKSQISELEKAGIKDEFTTIYSEKSGYVYQLNISEGEFRMEGAELMKIADMNTLWVEIQSFSGYSDLINKSPVVQVVIPGIREQYFSGKLEYSSPEIIPGTRLQNFRITVVNSEGRLKPGMQARVMVKQENSLGLTVPTDAVINSGKQAYVWVSIGQHKFKPVMVQKGKEDEFSVEILNGLREGDIVVTEGAYLLNSEYIFKMGNNPMHGHDMSKMK